MDVIRSTAPVPLISNGTAIAPGQIWRLSPEFYTYLNSYQHDREYKASETFWQPDDLPKYALIVKEPTESSDRVSVLPLGSQIEFVNELDLILPVEVSGLDRAVLIEAWHTFSMPATYLLEPVGKRLSQATYNLILDVGDSYRGFAKLPSPRTIKLHGLKTAEVSTVQQHQIEQFREREERWSTLFEIPIAEHYQQLRSSDIVKTVLQSIVELERLTKPTVIRQCLSGAPMIRNFVGRAAELKTLKQWIVKDGCKMIAISGNGGIGKSALAVSMAQQLKNHFNYVIWQSLRHAPTLTEIVANIIEVLSGGRESNRCFTESDETATDHLIHYLQTYSCLVIFDNFDALSPSDPEASEHYQSYHELLDSLQKAEHQSCVILTSRTQAAGDPERSWLARSISLRGLNTTAGMQLLKTAGVSGSKTELAELNELYSGNPLALKLAASLIKETFNNELDGFLSRVERAEFQDIAKSLVCQFRQLPDLEQSVMYWLAVNREAVSINQLQKDISQPTPRIDILNALGFLEQRSLVEKSGEDYTLQPLIMEWVTHQIRDQVEQEFQDQKFRLFNSHALVKAQSKDYIQANQHQQLLQPILSRLLSKCDRHQLSDRLEQILANLRMTSPKQRGYTAANAIAILRQLKSNFNHSNFSQLTIWQTDFQEIDLKEADLSHSDLLNSVFTKTLSSILTTSFHPDGCRIATGDKSGNLRIWQVPDGELLSTYKHYGGWIRAVSFSPNGELLASAGDAATIKLWDVQTGRCVRILPGHTDRVRSIQFSYDSCQLVSASDDQTIKRWDVETGTCLETLEGHIYPVRAVEFSPDACKIASAGDDQTVRLWDIETGSQPRILNGHTGIVFSLTFSPDGQTLVSASGDQTIKLWDVETGACYNMLKEHQEPIRAVNFSPDGQLLASGAQDKTVKLWNPQTGDCLRTLDGHTSWVRAIAFSPDSKTLASGSSDHTLRLWNPQTGGCIRKLQGYARRVWSIAAHSHKNLVASASEDHKVRLWDIPTGKCIQSLEGHTDWVRSVSFSPDGTWLASGSHDQTVRVWELASETHRILRGHTHRVRAVSFSPDGLLLATGGHDQTIRLWQVNSGDCLVILTGHSGCIRSLSFSPDGRILASGSPDQTVRFWDVASATCLRVFTDLCRISAVRFSPTGRWLASAGEDQQVHLWNVQTGKCVQSLKGHSRWVQSIAFDATGDLLVSGSEDQTVRVWNVQTGKCLAQLEAHESWIRSVAFSFDGQLVFSGGEDETVKVWDWQKKELLDNLSNPKPYERMNITGVTGLTDNARSALELLGAIDVDSSC